MEAGLSTTDDEQPLWRTAQQIADLFDVKLRTVWAWRRRGHITDVDGRYDLRQVLRWYDEQRATQMDAVRRGVARTDHPV